MQYKLLAIAVLALLLCATVPTATAAGKPAPTRTNVYMVEWNDRTGCYELGRVVGTVTTVDTATSDFAVTLKNIKAGHYTLVVSGSAAWSNTDLCAAGADTIHQTEKGDVTIQGKLSSEALGHYGNEGVFALVQLLPM